MRTTSSLGRSSSGSWLSTIPPPPRQLGPTRLGAKHVGTPASGRIRPGAEDARPVATRFLDKGGLKPTGSMGRFFVGAADPLPIEHLTEDERKIAERQKWLEDIERRSKPISHLH